ncbi:MAG: hypothetical protein ACFBSE_25635, partial [Prochloraceae cyanobacterium]
MISGKNKPSDGIRVSNQAVKSKRDRDLCLSIAVDEEIDRDNYFYTVRTGSKVLGIFTREFNSDTFIAKPYYHNP